MPKTKEIIREGKIIHESVGAIIKRDNQFLLIDRAIPPFGFAGVAGHVDDNEAPDAAIKREVLEESGLVVTDQRLLIEEFVDWNECSQGVRGHYWYVYECQVSGQLHRSEGETKSAGWYSINEIKNIKLEPAWEYWFKKFQVI